MNLKISIIQADLVWENIEKNLERFSDKILRINQPTDIIVLPEMFNTGFSMNSKALAESMNGKTVNWMKAEAKKAKAVIVGSLIIEEKEKYYNRLLWVTPEGSIQQYDKKHLFKMAGEGEYYTAGDKRLIINYKGWRVCLLVCYDLRFPVWARNVKLSVDKENKIHTGTAAYDCLIYIANWPETRSAHWSKLLEARAIENQSYVVGVNRIGVDGNGHSYTGNSAVINPLGNQISKTLPNEENMETVELSWDELISYRKKFPFIVDADELKC